MHTNTHDFSTHHSESIGGVGAAGIGFEGQVVHGFGPPQLLEVRVGRRAVQIAEVNVRYSQHRVAVRWFIDELPTSIRRNRPTAIRKWEKNIARSSMLKEFMKKGVTERTTSTLSITKCH